MDIPVRGAQTIITDPGYSLRFAYPRVLVDDNSL